MSRKFKKNLTKKEKKLLVRRMHRFLNNSINEIQFSWSDDYGGLQDPIKNTIYINFYDVVVKIFVHEYFHAIYPNMNHVAVKKIESKTIRKLTQREIKNLAKKIMLGRTITLEDFKTMPKPDKPYGVRIKTILRDFKTIPDD